MAEYREYRVAGDTWSSASATDSRSAVEVDLAIAEGGGHKVRLQTRTVTTSPWINLDTNVSRRPSVEAPNPLKGKR